MQKCHYKDTINSKKMADSITDIAKKSWVLSFSYKN